MTDDCLDTLIFAGLGLLIVATFYLCAHMLYNRIRGRDELDGVFRFRSKKKK